MQTILRLTGPSDEKSDDDEMLAAAIIDESKKPRTPPPLPTVGPEMARMMKVGTKVIRGPDWKWGDQVCKKFFQ